MSQPIDYLIQLHSKINVAQHRAAVVLEGSKEWQFQLIQEYLRITHTENAIKLGGEPIPSVELLGFKGGQQLLGGEKEVLIYDDSNGFDANSFTASTGCLVGGGILFLLINSSDSLKLRWFEKALSRLTRISQDQVVEGELQISEHTQNSFPDFSDQQASVESVMNVLSGHRKRPLVMLADRGRGKSSALGLATAKMIQQKKASVLLTAPARKAVDPVFEHAERNLLQVNKKSNNCLEAGSASLTFVSPDELIQTKPECDILLVDEASAIPLPLLISITESYHRVVFSTTVHGYEGCGRGFTLKFMDWLGKERPGWKSCELSKPIRWARQDPLENWLFDTFLLDAEISELDFTPSTTDSVTLKLISKTELQSNRELVRESFALLVAAHYQTSPNDLLQLFEDKATNLIHIETSGRLVGCILAHLEGGISPELVRDIISGKRRPKGHLIASTLAAQLGVEQAALSKCLRVMRIAIHPEAQRTGIGTKALSQLVASKCLNFDYVATSFGVTSELFHFWKDSGFIPVRLGAKRDQASGTHSIIMLKNNERCSWLPLIAGSFAEQLISLLPETFSKTEPELLSNILSNVAEDSSYKQPTNVQLIENYCYGAVSYESVFWELYKALCDGIINHNRRVPPILIAKVLQRTSWKEIASSFGLNGRKQVEEQIKTEIALYLNLQCKA